jgi:hypothetical protein
MVDGLKPGQRKILFCSFKRNFVKEAKVRLLLTFPCITDYLWFIYLFIYLFIFVVSSVDHRWLSSLVMCQNTQHTIMASRVWQVQLLEWLRILLAAITSTLCTLVVSLAPELRWDNSAKACTYEVLVMT